ncbi:hypothetical protein Vadar_013329 [Vaccinium darrowii]|uniref:Uncharacterized protein n=1 Tax=Vaccinium darrowii TaxID=229202 RepID=A0ACB7YV83_9ERIC|nr:hypothetical protein Vadar_013329 [Vaccinium darrowii]
MASKTSARPSPEQKQKAFSSHQTVELIDSRNLPSLVSETNKLSLVAPEKRQPGKHFTEQAVKFYVAEVLLAMEYLHMLGGTIFWMVKMYASCLYLSVSNLYCL